MSIYIFTDTTADFPSELMTKYSDIGILPMPFSLDQDNYDNIETTLPIEEFYRRVESGAVTRTSMVPTYIMEQRFVEQLEKGNDIIFESVSSGISGNYNGGVSVMNQLRAKYPNRKMETIDTLLASGGESLHMFYVLEKRDTGVGFDELVAYANSLRNNISSYFTCSDLKHLARMGRVSNAVAFIGTALKIMPTMYVNTTGKLIAMGKVISRKKALKFLLEKMDSKMLPKEEQKLITIVNSDCKDDANFIKSEIEQKYGLKVLISDIGPVIGSHTSSGCIALFFLTNDRKDVDDTNKK